MALLDGGAMKALVNAEDANNGTMTCAARCDRTMSV
jgi:hypothetical protein